MVRRSGERRGVPRSLTRRIIFAVEMEIKIIKKKIARVSGKHARAKTLCQSEFDAANKSALLDLCLFATVKLSGFN